MPVYHYDKHLYHQHLKNGGTFNEFKDKTYLPLTDLQFIKHLKGEHIIGIYPLLKDNNSLFIAADFDKESWAEECRTLILACKEIDIPAYLERSRSGKDGHVWIFFEQPYPAVKSRGVLINLLEHSGVFSKFDKSSSFDRLFPNQNIHSGKGIGNLIALPLQKPAREQGNSCFVDAQLKAYQNQWSFLSSIQRVSISQLDAVYASLH